MEGRTNYELRETFIMPENASQGMQAFKPRLPLSREGSGIKSREGSGVKSSSPSIKKEKSGNMRRSVGGDSTDFGSRLSAPAVRRGKSDLDRDGKQIPSPLSKDYSGVRGSGYGTTYNSPKTKKVSGAEGMTRTPSQPKITREKSGDIYSRLSSPRTPVTKTTSSTRSSVSKAPTPRRSTPSVKIPKLSVTDSAGVTSPTKTSPTKPKTGGVFGRLSSQGTATRKASEMDVFLAEGTTKKEALPKKEATPKAKKQSKVTDPAASKRKTTTKK